MTKRLFLILFLLSFLILPFQPAHAQEPAGLFILSNPVTAFPPSQSDSISSVNELMAANDITDPNQLAAGQQLVIPGLEGVTGVVTKHEINIRRFISQSHAPHASPADTFPASSTTLSAQVNFMWARQHDHPRNRKLHPNSTGVFPAHAGESLLELAVKQNTDVWSLAHYNGSARFMGWPARRHPFRAW